MLENAVERGLQLMTGLSKLQEDYPQLADVRGRGLMIATEFTAAGRPEKAKSMVKDVVHACEEADLLLLTCGTYDNTIRWIPPLNANADQIGDALGAFSQALKKTQ